MVVRRVRGCDEHDSDLRRIGGPSSWVTELPATGKRVEVRGMEFVEMRDGKVVVDNLYYDNLAVAAQLGLFPQLVPATVS